MGNQPAPGRVLRWLHGAIKTPPFSSEARREAGGFLRALQDGDMVSMPHSRPMPSIGSRCHELRVRDVGGSWRVIYRIDPDEIVIVEVFRKKTQKTPQQVIETCKDRLRRFDAA